jgi:Xaa-Pro aminopeptidase
LPRALRGSQTGGEDPDDIDRIHQTIDGWAALGVGDSLAMASVTLPTDERTAVRARVRDRLDRDRVDAYLAYLPANLHYTTGYRSYFVSHWWRFHGCAFGLLPADAALAPGLVAPAVEEASARAESGYDDVRTFSMWMETRELDVIARPSDGPRTRTDWFDVEHVDRQLRELLGDRGLLGATIGTDLRFMAVPVLERLRALAPEVTWVDFTEPLWEVRSVKEPWEIEHLHRAQELLDAGLVAIRDGLELGITSAGVGRLFQRGVLDAVDADQGRYAGYSDQWMITSVGSEGKIGIAEGETGLRRGELVKFDGGVTVHGYKGDGGRTFAIGEPSGAARALYDALREANARAVDRLRPGVPVAEAFLAAERSMHAAGYPSYIRGQYGHSIGLEDFPEEPPYIARDEHRPVEPGMVFAVETPYYGSDIGSIMIEDLWVVEADGPRCLNALPRDLFVL